MNEMSLANELKSGVVRRIYYLHGKEVFLTEMYRERIIKKIAVEDDDFNLIKIKGNPDLETFSDAVNCAPVFAEHKVVLINDFDFEKGDSDYSAGFMSIAESIPTCCSVVISITGIVLDTKKAKTKKLLALIDNIGAVCEFVAMDAAKISSLIEKKALRNNCQISRDVSLYLSEITLRNLTLISAETDKLCAYANEIKTGEKGVITRETVDLLVPKHLDTGIFTLAGEVKARNSKKAFKILNELVEIGYPPANIVNSLASTFVDLYWARIAIENRMNSEHVKKDFAYPANRDWVVSKAFGMAKNMNISYLRKCVKVLRDADIKLKSTTLNKYALTGDAYIMEKAVGEMLYG